MLCKDKQISNLIGAFTYALVRIAYNCRTASHFHVVCANDASFLRGRSPECCKAIASLHCMGNHCQQCQWLSPLLSRPNGVGQGTAGN